MCLRAPKMKKKTFATWSSCLSRSERWNCLDRWKEIRMTLRRDSANLAAFITTMAMSDHMFKFWLTSNSFTFRRSILDKCYTMLLLLWAMPAPTITMTLVSYCTKFSEATQSLSDRSSKLTILHIQSLTNGTSSGQVVLASLISTKAWTSTKKSITSLPHKRSHGKTSCRLT